MLYLFAGIAAYIEKQSELEQDYYEEVQKLNSNSQLAQIVQNDSMCYGVNYPLNHVIVFDEMGEKCSIGCSLLIDKKSRSGRCFQDSQCIFGEKTFVRLIKYLNGQSEETERDEAQNIKLQSKRMIQHLIELSLTKVH